MYNACSPNNKMKIKNSGRGISFDGTTSWTLGNAFWEKYDIMLARVISTIRKTETVISRFDVKHFEFRRDFKGYVETLTACFYSHCNYHFL